MLMLSHAQKAFQDCLWAKPHRVTKLRSGVHMLFIALNLTEGEREQDRSNGCVYLACSFPVAIIQNAMLGDVSLCLLVLAAIDAGIFLDFSKHDVRVDNRCCAVGDSRRSAGVDSLRCLHKANDRTDTRAEGYTWDRQYNLDLTYRNVVSRNADGDRTSTDFDKLDSHRLVNIDPATATGNVDQLHHKNRKQHDRLHRHFGQHVLL